MVVDEGMLFDLMIIDEHFKPGGQNGSEAIKEIRSKSMHNEVIVLCTGNSASMASMLRGGLVDAIWGKPLPSWRDGSMQAQLYQLLKKRAADKLVDAQNGPQNV